MIWLDELLGWNSDFNQHSLSVQLLYLGFCLERRLWTTIPRCPEGLTNLK